MFLLQPTLKDFDIKDKYYYVLSGTNFNWPLVYVENLRSSRDPKFQLTEFITEALNNVGIHYPDRDSKFDVARMDQKTYNLQKYKDYFATPQIVRNIKRFNSFIRNPYIILLDMWTTYSDVVTKSYNKHY